MTKAEAIDFIDALRLLDEPDYPTPCAQAVARAKACVELTEAEPVNAAGLPDGGVFLKYVRGDVDSYVEFNNDGEITFVSFVGAKLLSNIRVPDSGDAMT